MTDHHGVVGRDSPIVSVILTTYQREAALPRAVESVLSQTMADFELLVIDDEPSSAVAELVGSYGDPRVRYLANHDGQGVSSARNAGIRASTAANLAFLDDDDVYLPHKLERQIALLERSGPAVGVVSCFEEVKRRDGSSVVRPIILDGDVHRRLLREDLLRIQALLVRRECLSRVGMFDERLLVHEDYDMSLRLARTTHFATVEDPLVAIIGTPGSLSTDPRKRIAALDVLFSSHPELRHDRRVRARWLRRRARHHQEIGDHVGWRRDMWRSLRSNPVDPLTVASLAAGVMLGPAAHQQAGRLRGRLAKRRRRRTSRASDA